MEIRYFKHYSSNLQRDMEFKVYGHSGKPVLFVPCQAGRFWDFEAFHMIDTWAKWIEAGDVTVFSMDTIDGETWADKTGDCAYRVQQHERWYNYTIEELVPAIKHLSGERNGCDLPIMTFGCSMGAMHAANFFFRRPDIFSSVLALSGIYDSKDAFGDYMDGTLYNNCPNYYLANIPADHYYIDMYNQRKAIICVGQGAWEDELKVSTAQLAKVCHEKGIHAQVDFWGYDVNHDWDWWFKQCDHYVPQLIY